MVVGDEPRGVHGAACRSRSLVCARALRLLADTISYGRACTPTVADRRAIASGRPQDWMKWLASLHRTASAGFAPSLPPRHS